MRTLTFALLSALSALTFSEGTRADTLADDADAVLNLDDDFVNGLDAITSFTLLPDGRMVVTQKTGEVFVRTTDGALVNAGKFEVDSGSEKGLLNVLAHPSFGSNGLLFFYYSQANGDAGDRSRDRHRVSTVRLGANHELDFATLDELVTGLYGPANHDGGALAIGPDGKLYIGVGDTGCNSRRFVDSDSPPANYYSTCLTNGNGKILRVNLDGTIPSDNPLVGRTVTACGAGCADIPSGSGAAREDIWAWGFRNPWRFWFDPQNGNLWVGDVGELSYEEINIIPQSKKGKHYGWPWREGRKGHPRGACETATAGAGECEEPAYVCRQSGFADPATPDLCRSITGGVIVDSCDWPAAFRGRYYFGDNALVPAPVWSVAVNRERSAVVQDSRRELLQASSPVIHFEAGKDNALYYAVHGGRIGRITPKSPGVCPDGGAGSGGSAGSSGAAGGAGSPGSGGVGGADAGPGQAGSSGSGNDDGSGDDGCGCSVPGASAPKLAGLGIAASALLLWSRLRRSGSSLKKGRGGRPMV